MFIRPIRPIRVTCTELRCPEREAVEGSKYPCSYLFLKINCGILETFFENKIQNGKDIYVLAKKGLHFK